MTARPDLPGGLELVRTTPVFVQDTVPAGLGRAHQVAAGVWGCVVVLEGTVELVFEDEPDDPIVARIDQPVPIPPGRLHHVVPSTDARFRVEFYR